MRTYYNITKNRSSIAAAILQNPEMLESAYNESLNADGSAEEAMETSLTSIDSHVNRLNNSIQTMWQNSMDSSVLIFFVEIAKLITDIIGKAGILETTIAGIVGFFMAKGGLNVADLFRSNKEAIDEETSALKQNNVAKEEGEAANIAHGDSEIVDAEETTVNTAGINSNTESQTINNEQKVAGQEANIVHSESEGADSVSLEQNSVALDQNTVSQQANNAAKSGGILQGIKGKAKYIAKNNRFVSNVQSLREEAADKKVKDGTEGVGSKLKGFGATLGRTLVNMAAITAVIKLVELGWSQITKGIESRAKLSEEVKTKNDELKESQKTLEDNSSYVEDNIERYEKLSKGVNEFGQNVGLSNSDFQEYNKISNEIAERFPELVQGYSSTGDAILKCKDNVSLLNQTLNTSSLEHYAKVLEGASDGIEDIYNKTTRKADLVDSFTLMFSDDGGDRSITQRKEDLENLKKFAGALDGERLATLFNPIEADAKNKGIDLGIDYKDLLEGYDKIPEKVKDKFDEYNKVLDKELEKNSKKIDPYLNAWLETSYSANPEIDDKTKTALSAFVKNIDTELYNQFKNSPDAYENYIDNIVGKVSNNKELQGNLANFFTLDKDKLSAEDYLDSAKEYGEKISKVLSDGKFKIDSNTFLEKQGINTKEIESTIKEAREKLGDSIKNKKSVRWFEGLKLDDTKLINSDEYKKNLEQITEQSGKAIASVKDLKKALVLTKSAKLDNLIDVANTISDLDGFKKTVEQTTTDVNTLQSALSEQNKTGYITQDTYKALIDSNKDYEKCLETTSYGITLNAQKAREMIKANADQRIAEIRVAEAMRSQQYQINAEKIKQLKAQKDNLSDAGKKELSTLQEENEKIKTQVNEYKLLRDQLVHTTSAFTAWQNAASNSQDVGFEYDTMVEGLTRLKELYKGGLFGTEEWKTQIEAYFGKDFNLDNFKSELKDVKRYLTGSSDGVNNFIKDVAKLKNADDGSVMANINKDGTFTFDIHNLEDMRKQLGITETVAEALFDKLKAYGVELDFSNIEEDADSLESMGTELVDVKQKMDDLEAAIDKKKEVGYDTKDDIESLKELRQTYEAVKQKLETEGIDTNKLIEQSNEESDKTTSQEVDEVNAKLDLTNGKLTGADETVANIANNSETVANAWERTANAASYIAGLSPDGGGSTSGSTGGTSGTSGTAHASGTFGSVNGDHIALVGEMDEELIVDPKTGTWRTVGTNGAEFANIGKDDIVFNHKQTEELLSKGKTKSRGKAKSTSSIKGFAHAGGNIGSINISKKEDEEFGKHVDKFGEIVSGFETETKKVSKDNKNSKEKDISTSKTESVTENREINIDTEQAVEGLNVLSDSSYNTFSQLNPLFNYNNQSLQLGIVEGETLGTTGLNNLANGSLNAFNQLNPLFGYNNQYLNIGISDGDTVGKTGLDNISNSSITAYNNLTDLFSRFNNSTFTFDIMQNVKYQTIGSNTTTNNTSGTKTKPTKNDLDGDGIPNMLDADSPENMQAKVVKETGAKGSGTSVTTNNKLPQKLPTGSDINKKKSSSGSKSKPTPEVFDFIEKRLEKLRKAAERTIDRIAEYLTETGKELQIKRSYEKVNAEYSANNTAYNKYMAQANKSKKYTTGSKKKKKTKKISSRIIKGIQGGTFDIKTIKDENLKKAIQDYQSWYEKAQNCIDANDQLRSTMADLADQWANIPVETAEKKLEKYNNELSILETKLSNIEQYNTLSGNYSSNKRLINSQKDKNEEILSTQAKKVTDTGSKLNESKKNVKTQIDKASYLTKNYKKTLKDQIASGKEISTAKLKGKALEWAQKYNASLNANNEAKIGYDQGFQDYISNINSLNESLYNIPLDKCTSKVEELSNSFSILSAELERTGTGANKSVLLTKEKKNADDTINEYIKSNSDALAAKNAIKKSLANTNTLKGTTSSEKEVIRNAINSGKAIDMSALTTKEAVNIASEWNNALKASKDANEQLLQATSEYIDSLSEIHLAYASIPLDDCAHKVEKLSSAISHLSSEIEIATTSTSKSSLINKQIGRERSKFVEYKNAQTTAYNNYSSKYDELRNSRLLDPTQMDKLFSIIYNDQSQVGDIEEFLTKNNISKTSQLGKSLLDKATAVIQYRDKKNEAKTQYEDSLEEYRQNMIILGESLGNLPIDDCTKSVDKLSDALSLVEKKLGNTNSLEKAGNFISDMAESYRDQESEYREAFTKTTNNYNKAKKEVTASTLKATKAEKSYMKAQIKLGEEIDLTKLTSEDAIKVAGKYNGALNANKEAEKEASNAVEDLVTNLKSLADTAINKVKEQFEKFNTVTDAKQSNINSRISTIEARGYAAGTEMYKTLIDLNADKQGILESERLAVQKRISKNIADGYYTEDDPEYFEDLAELYGISDQIEECVKNTVEWNDAIRQLNWDKFDDLMSRLKAIEEETSFLSDLFMETELTDDLGLTDKGIASMGLKTQNYDAYMEKAKLYKKEVEKINLDLARDPNNKELIERKDELVSSYQDCINAAKSEKEAVIDLIEKGYNAKIDGLQKLIDKQKELLNIEKRTHDYEKSISKQKDNIIMLEKQIAALSLSTDRSDIAKKLKLEEELNDAKEQMEEEQYNHSIETQEEALDKSLELYREKLEEYLKDSDKVFADAVDICADKSVQILSTIQDKAIAVGYTIQQDLLTVWNNTTPVSTYEGSVNTAMNGVKAVISSVNDKLREQYEWYEKIAKQQVEFAKSSWVDSTSSTSTTDVKDNNTTTSTSDTNNKLIREVQAILDSPQLSGNLNADAFQKYLTSIGHGLNVRGYAALLDVLAPLTKKGDYDTKLYGVDRVGYALEMFKKLAKQASFSKGGTFDIQRVTGEDGIALVKRKEGILSREQMTQFNTLTDNLVPLNKAVNYVIGNSHGSIKSGMTGIEAPINVTVEGNLDNVTLDQLNSAIKKVPDMLIKEMNKFGTR